MRYHRVFLPLDGSALAERALPVAARIARASGATLVCRHVVSLPAALSSSEGALARTDTSPVLEERVAHAAAALKETVAAHARDLTGIRVEIAVDAGPTAAAVLGASEAEHADLIVMSSHGRGGLLRWMLGSVAQETLRESPIPLLIVQERGAHLAALGTTIPLRVLVPLDGSAQAEQVLKPLLHLLPTLAPAGQVWLHLLRVIDSDAISSAARRRDRSADDPQSLAIEEAQTYLQHIATWLAGVSPSELQLTITTSHLISTDVAAAIVREAEAPGAEMPEARCDLIALATHGREHLHLGSIAEQLLATTHLPLFIIRARSSAKQPM